MEDVSSSAAIRGQGGRLGLDGRAISIMSAKGPRQPPAEHERDRRRGARAARASRAASCRRRGDRKGRKETPSRLTPVPYVDGQSGSQLGPEAAPPAGGKRAGGGEGLKAPCGPPGERDLNRLAGTQAALRQGRRVDYSITVMGYHHTDLRSDRDDDQTNAIDVGPLPERARLREVCRRLGK